MYKNKRGMSAIVTMLIIVALSLVAIGVVWYVIQNLISNTEDTVTQGSDDLFTDCPTADVTDETDSGEICVEGEEIRIIGGEYCCIV